MYLLVGDKLNTRTLLVVLECLKDRAFHIETVYVNSLDPSRGCTLQAELIVTTSLEPSGSDSEIVPLQWESVVDGTSHSRMDSWFVLKGLCSPQKLFENFLISPLCAHCLKHRRSLLILGYFLGGAFFQQASSLTFLTPKLLARRMVAHA